MDSPYFSRTGSGGSVSFLNNKYYDRTLGWVQTADQGTARTSAFITSMLEQMRTVKPTYTTDLPAGVTDARLYRVNLRNGATGVHIKPLTFTIAGSPGAGAISREVWTGISGTQVALIPVGTPPNTTDTLPSFEAPTNWADNYGTRLRGYITAPVTGNYTFWIASDDKSELWLSTDDNPVNKVKIASVPDWTDSREWNKFSSQKSAPPIPLTAGQRYYVEALQKEGDGGDNLAVGWAKPGQSTSAPSEVIPGSVLSPFSVTSGLISREVWTGISATFVANIPVGTPPNTTDTLPSFEAPTNWADNYGTRLRGYITAPVTGSYTFWIASDDKSELWLSTDDSPVNKVKIASVPDWTDSRQWDKFSSQKSAAPISLTAGQRYYVEALQKEGDGGDNLAVGWAKPGQATSAPSEVIPGSVLSPFSGGSP